jgi:hypothetical protein
VAILIRGTDITLYTAGGTETVTNVLIGEPTAEGCTLGIPKGDTHDWTDRKIGFFGRLWRTVGVPAQGIEENIPLLWHKKVTVRPLRITGAVTVYTASTYVRHFYPETAVTDLRGLRTAKTGEQHEGTLSVQLYAVCPSDGYVPRAGDILVQGDCAVTVDASSEASASQGVAALRACGYAVIRAVTAEQIGVQPDYVIEAG